MKLKYENMLNPDKKKVAVTPMNGVLTLETVQNMFKQFMAQLNGSPGP